MTGVTSARPALSRKPPQLVVRMAEPRSEAVAPVKRIVPSPASTMRRAAARPTWKPPRQPMRQHCSEYSSFIRQHGGDVGALIESLRQRVAAGVFTPKTGETSRLQ